MYLERVDGASVRGDNVFVIRELEICGPDGFNPMFKEIGAGFTRFSVSDFLPHSRRIFGLNNTASFGFFLGGFKTAL